MIENNTTHKKTKIEKHETQLGPHTKYHVFSMNTPMFVIETLYIAFFLLLSRAINSNKSTFCQVKWYEHLDVIKT
jgi:hypothetical protein